MKTIGNRIFPYLLGVFTLLLSIIFYLFFIDKIGFSDGYVSDYQLAMKQYFQLTLMPLLLLGVYFFYVGGGKPKNENKKPLMLGVCFLICYVILKMTAHGYFYFNLDHEQGG